MEQHSYTGMYKANFAKVHKYPKTKKISRKNSNFKKILKTYLENTLIKKCAKFHEAGTNRKKVMSGELKGREKKKKNKKKNHLLDPILLNLAKS